MRERAPPHRTFAVKSIPIEKLQFKYKDAKDYVKEVSFVDSPNPRCVGGYHERFAPPEYHLIGRLLPGDAA